MKWGGVTPHDVTALNLSNGVDSYGGDVILRLDWVEVHFYGKTKQKLSFKLKE